MTERDLKDQAHRRMTRGDIGGALETYKQLIVMNGKEATYRLRHADLSQRLGREQAAVGSYRVAALLLSKDGRLAQAKAALHSAVRLAPKDLSLRRELKELLDAQSGPAFSGPPVLGADERDTEPCLLPMLE